jgi:hypothetical protein
LKSPPVFGGAQWVTHAVPPDREARGRHDLRDRGGEADRGTQRWERFAKDFVSLMRLSFHSMPLETRPTLPTRIAPAIGLAALAVGTLWLRTSNVSQEMWLLADQIRDWRIALLPWRELPGHGPPTIAGGYTFGPIFYWMLWTYARIGGTFADALPHTAVAVQAVVSGLIDLVLCAALYRRLRTWSVAIAVLLWQVSAPIDLVVARTLWNPNQALDFGKLAIAIVLWGPADLTTARRMVIAGTAVLSTHAHWSGLPLTVSILGWLIARAVCEERRVGVRGLMEIVAVLFVLQLPAFLNGSITSMWPRLGADAVASVTIGGVMQRLHDASYVMANSIERFLVGGIGPQPFAILLVASLLATRRLRHEWDLAAITIAPLIAVLLLVLTWPGRIEDYWFRVVAPSAALLLVFGVIEVSRWIGAAPAQAGVVLLAVAVILLPYRIRAASQLGRLPAYGPLVRASRALAASAVRVRDVAAPWYPGVIEGIPIGGFIPNTSNQAAAAAVYESVAGPLDPSARESAVLHEDGTFELRND